MPYSLYKINFLIWEWGVLIFGGKKSENLDQTKPQSPKDGNPSTGVDIKT